MNTRRFSTALFLALPGTAAASPGAAGAPTTIVSGAYLAQVLGSLVLVFLCLFAVVYALRRFNRMGQARGAPLRVLGSASVGTRERVVLLEAGEQQLLIGVAQGSVRTLHVLPEPIAAPEPAAASVDFAQVLRAANPLGGGQS